jgi:hypothetical protein
MAPTPLQVGTTSVTIFAPQEPTSFTISFPFTNTDFVSISLSATDAQSEKIIQCFPASKLTVRNFKGRVVATANSGTQSYFLFVVPHGQEPFEYVSDIAGLVLVASPAGASIGSANAQNQVVISAGMAGEMALLITATGGTFPASTSATVDVSLNGVTFITVDAITLTSGAAAVGKQYDKTHLASVLVVNPSAFPYIRITVPALGAGIASSILWGGKLS